MSGIHITRLENVIIEGRQRTVDEDVENHIKELGRDILENGLIHAVTIDANNRLVAGFCRLHALKQIKSPYYYAGEKIDPGYVPCVITHKKDDKDLFRIELMENLRRKNLSPVDEARAIAALHENYATTRGDWSKQDTASVLESLGREAMSNAQRDITNAQLVAKFAEDPNVQKAETMTEAVRLAKKADEKKKREDLGASVVVESEDYKVFLGDCLIELHCQPSNKFDGIIADPPYGIDAEKFGEQTGANSHEYKDDAKTALRIAEAILVQGARVCRAEAHLYMFCDIRLFGDLSKMAEAAGWSPFRTPIVWKKSTGHMPWPRYFQRSYETILFAQKGKRPLGRVTSDVLDFSSVRDKVHSAEKPYDLLKHICDLSFRPGDYILDPCCGSGSIFPVARALKLRAVGIEKELSAYNTAKARAAGVLE